VAEGGGDGRGRVRVQIGLGFINALVATSLSGGGSSPLRQHPCAIALGVDTGVDTGATVQTAPSPREAVMNVMELLHSSRRSSCRRRITGAFPAIQTIHTSVPPSSLLREADGARGVGAIRSGSDRGTLVSPRGRRLRPQHAGSHHNSKTKVRRLRRERATQEWPPRPELLLSMWSLTRPMKRRPWRPARAGNRIGALLSHAQDSRSQAEQLLIWPCCHQTDGCDAIHDDAIDVGFRWHDAQSPSRWALDEN